MRTLLVRQDPPGIAPFRSRGPGNCYRLVQAASKVLATPVARR